MKKLILLFAMISINSYSYSQQPKETFCEYTACGECFDHWETLGFENYTINSHSKKESEARQQTRKYAGGIITVFASAITFLFYNLINKTINEIH